MTQADIVNTADVVSGLVVTVGSINVDTVVSIDEFPGPGETRMAEQVRTHLGGKGLSQAIAAARFGSPCALIGVVGNDENGRLAVAALDVEGIDRARVRMSALPTGQAFVWVDSRAENKIAVVPGANAELHALTEADVEVISRARVVLTQFESGTEIAIDAVLAGRAAGATIILNAAPALPVADDVLRAVDLLVVNEVEVLQFHSTTDIDGSAFALAETTGAVLVTLGSRGGRLYRSGMPVLEIRAPRVSAVDTTGAGDVSCGVIAAALAQGEELDSAIELAFAAGALAVQVEGNASAIPTRERVVGLARLRDSA